MIHPTGHDLLTKKVKILKTQQKHFVTKRHFSSAFCDNLLFLYSWTPVWEIVYEQMCLLQLDKHYNDYNQTAVWQKWIWSRIPMILHEWRSISTSQSLIKLTALKTSSRWPSTPPKMATRVSVWMFQRRSAWSDKHTANYEITCSKRCMCWSVEGLRSLPLLTDSKRFGSLGWNLSSLIALPWPT